jgi:uncharacterized membrane protein
VVGRYRPTSVIKRLSTLNRIVTMDTLFSRQSLSGIGIVVGTLFFAASLTPTLVPRTYLTQGVLAGACFAIGYGTGALWRRLWLYLEIPDLPSGLRAVANGIVSVLCAAIAVFFLWHASEWQNSIRAAMSLSPVESGRPLRVCVVALVTFAALLVAARLFAALARSIARFTRRYVPRRVANLVGFGLAAILIWSLANNVLARIVFDFLDSSYSKYDAFLEPEQPQPTDSGKTGSPASLLKWGELGRAGREFIAGGPTAAEIGAFTHQPAREPIRVYVGLRSADDARARAQLALAELKRIGGFDRSILIVVTPTGTGWVDPSSIDAVEYLHHGDVASVAVQYSYLSSPLSLLAQPEKGADAARALFLAIYDYWTTLPRDARPKLYLHGLSLGAMNSEKSAGLFEMIGDPISGALWSGPPFGSGLWRSVTDARNEGSTQWLPVFRDSRLVRFMNQKGSAAPADAPWGPLRIVYLQYASDPIVFFDYRDAYRRPAWMSSPRGPDVSPDLKWFPIVSMLQIALDMAFATGTPIGYGHVYAPKDYVEAWAAVTGATDWSPQSRAGLAQYLAGNAIAGGEERGG